MSTFRCPIVEVSSVDPIPNADRIDVANVAGWQVVILKDQFQPGDHAIYLPESAVLPDQLIDTLGLTGKLAGKQRNRIKAIRLRQVLSQGVLAPVELARSSPDEPLELGFDCAERLGVHKWVPPVPVRMNGVLEPALTVKFDVENLKAYPDVFTPGERVQITEKLHGTFCEIGWVIPTDADPVESREGLVVSSKGFAAQQLGFKHPAEPDTDGTDPNVNNLYVREARKHVDALRGLAEELGVSVYLLGEIIGPRINDLGYHQSEPRFMLFDVHLGNPGGGNSGWINPTDLVSYAERVGVDHVPVLHEGPYDSALVNRLTVGSTDVAPSAPLRKGWRCIREGVVIRAVPNRRDARLGRVMLKSISSAYLVRKGGTEHE